MKIKFEEDKFKKTETSGVVLGYAWKGDIVSFSVWTYMSVCQ